MPAGSLNPFYAALRDVLGPTKTTNLQAAAAIGVLVQVGRGEVYGLDIIASAVGNGTYNLVDASATGITGTILWGTQAIPTSFAHEFVRPLLYTKGLVLSYTATAAVTLNSNVSFSPNAGII